MAEEHTEPTPEPSPTSEPEATYHVIVVTEGGAPDYEEMKTLEELKVHLSKVTRFCEDAMMWSKIFIFKGTRISLSTKKTRYEVDLGGEKFDLEGRKDIVDL